VPIRRANIRVPHDFFEKLLRENGSLPDVAAHVSGAELLMQAGNVVSPVRGIGFLAFLLLPLREGRKHVIEMSYRATAYSRIVLHDEVEV